MDATLDRAQAALAAARGAGLAVERAQGAAYPAATGRGAPDGIRRHLEWLRRER